MRAVLRWTAIGAGLLLVLTAGLCLASYRKFSANITTDSAAEKVLTQYAAQRPPSLVPQARNILVMGAETETTKTETTETETTETEARDTAATDPETTGPEATGPETANTAAKGSAGKGAAAKGSAAGLAAATGIAATDAAATGTAAAGADAAVLLHLSADRTRAAAIGVPRDLRVSVPGCRRPGGGVLPAAREPFAAAFSGGGAACAIRAFEQLSGVRVDHHLVVDVPSFDRLAAAVCGGAQGPARGWGADRDPRRDLLPALTGTAGGGGSLAHPARLFGLLDTATSAITADPGLSSLPALYELAGALRSLPDSGVTLITLPIAPGSGNVLRRPAADRLFAALRADRPLTGYAGP